MTNCLSENLVLQKTRVDNLRYVKNLNLWGNDLSDVSLLREMVNVEVLSLSVNKISTLKDFANCLKLQELYLRKNQIRDLEEVNWLKNLPVLKILWLCDNPCAESPLYRPYIIRALPHLEKLDNVDVSPQERAAAQRISEQEVEAITEKKPKPRPKQTVAKQEVVDNARSKWQPQAPETDAAWQQPPAPAYVAAPARDSAPATPPASTPVQQPHIAPSQPARAAKPKAKSNKSGSSQKNILTAVLSLLNELNTESLEIVHQEISERLYDANR
eukprot:TRINITY_DN94335_c0_g1_i1.p1 TRINITY_DN94335_c0_g1~~TRINITY_DN94335_c0_g1_i1.p1  ORF type:complete len:282 (+),score=41.89 TRINITY_DN94335_c0_g1_i1:33-848(+)